MQTKNTQVHTKRMQILWLVLLPVVFMAGLQLAVRLYAWLVAPYLPPCLLRTLTGWRCPSCGMTHSVYALARLDIPTALQENLLIPLALCLGLIWYAERWCALFGMQKTLLPRKAWFWLVLLVFTIWYTILRNIL